MRTEKKTKCEGECCTEQAEESELTQEALDAEKSKCVCIKKKTECGAECGCIAETCRNRQMSRNRSLKKNVDFEERTAWGIDLCTTMNLFDIMPRDVPLANKTNFLEKRVLFAIQQQGENGFDIFKALNFILTQALAAQE